MPSGQRLILREIRIPLVMASTIYVAHTIISIENQNDAGQRGFGLLRSSLSFSPRLSVNIR
jgi:hypothetical protein